MNMLQQKQKTENRKPKSETAISVAPWGNNFKFTPLRSHLGVQQKYNKK